MSGETSNVNGTRQTGDIRDLCIGRRSSFMAKRYERMWKINNPNEVNLHVEYSFNFFFFFLSLFIIILILVLGKRNRM